MSVNYAITPPGFVSVPTALKCCTQVRVYLLPRDNVGSKQRAAPRPEAAAKDLSDVQKHVLVVSMLRCNAKLML